MNIRTLFNPMRLEVDGVETPIVEHTYLDEDGNTQTCKYAIVNGEKQIIERRWDLDEKILQHRSLDVALAKVEEVRVQKVELKRVEEEKRIEEERKANEPKPDPIDPIKP